MAARRRRIGGRLAAAWLVAAAVVVVLPAMPAAACSCARTSAAVVAQQSPEVVIGVPTEVADRAPEDGAMGSFQRRVYRIEVREARKGQVPAVIEVWTGMGQGDCGIDLVLGQEVALAPSRFDGRRSISSCGGVIPVAEARALVFDAPAPTGQGPPAFAVGGWFGPAWLALLDAEGRPLAYATDGLDPAGFLRTVPVFCAGGTRLAVARISTGSDDVGFPTALGVYDVASLSAEWTRPLAADLELRHTTPSIACTEGGLRMVVGSFVGSGPGPVLVVDAGPDTEAAVTATLVSSLAGAVDPRDGSVVTVDGQADDPSTWRIVRRAGTPLAQSPAQDLAVLAPPPGAAGERRIAGMVVDPEGRIAVGHGPKGSLGLEIDRITTLAPDGSLLAKIDPAMPAMPATPVRDLRWVAADDLAVVAGGGPGTIAFRIRADGTGRRDLALGDHRTVLTVGHGDTDLVGFSAYPGYDDPAGPVAALAPDGTVRHQPLGSLIATGAAAVPPGAAITLMAAATDPARARAPLPELLPGGPAAAAAAEAEPSPWVRALGASMAVAIVAGLAAVVVVRSRRRSKPLGA